MGKQGLAAFLSEPRFEGLPATLETPGPNKKGADRKEVQAAKRLRKTGLKRAGLRKHRAPLHGGSGIHAPEPTEHEPSCATASVEGCPVSPADSLFDVDAGDRAGDDQALDL